MAKVDWITWKTEPNEIINPDNILEIITEKFQDFNTYMNPVVYEGISYEVTDGGLDKSSLNILGISPANEMATNILNNIDEIKSIIENLKLEVYSQAEEQKQIEKKQLIFAIENKLAQEEKKLTELTSVDESLSQPEILKMKVNRQDEIDIAVEKINRLKERLELAKSI